MTRRRPDPEPALSIFPNQIHIGDRFSEADIGDEDGEWEVVSRPVTFKKGQEVRACVQRPDNPAASREKYWPAFQKITVRPGGPRMPATTESHHARARRRRRRRGPAQGALAAAGRGRPPR